VYRYVSHDDKLWYGTTLLHHYLGSYPDCVYVIKDGVVVYAIDGKDVLEHIYKEQRFCPYSLISELENKMPIFTVSEDHKIGDLLEEWKKTRRARALVQRDDQSIFPISLRTLIEVCATMETDKKISDIQKKSKIICSADTDIMNMIKLMLQNRVRRIFIDDTTSFISDRIIISNIVNDYHVLENNDLNTLPTAVIIPPDTNIRDVARQFTLMPCPCILSDNKVISPWDVLMAYE
jgi:CBS domain-containing protein